MSRIRTSSCIQWLHQHSRNRTARQHPPGDRATITLNAKLIGGGRYNYQLSVISLDPHIWHAVQGSNLNLPPEGCFVIEGISCEPSLNYLHKFLSAHPVNSSCVPFPDTDHSDWSRVNSQFCKHPSERCLWADKNSFAWWVAAHVLLLYRNVTILYTTEEQSAVH